MVGPAAYPTGPAAKASLRIPSRRWGDLGDDLDRHDHGGDPDDLAEDVYRHCVATSTPGSLPRQMSLAICFERTRLKNGMNQAMKAPAASRKAIP